MCEINEMNAQGFDPRNVRKVRGSLVMALGFPFEKLLYFIIILNLKKFSSHVNHLYLKSVFSSTFCFYGCETWFLALRKEHRLREFDNKVLKKIRGP